MTIDYYTRNNFGTLTDYIVSPTQAQAMSALTGKRTISASDREALTALCGVQWRKVPDPRLN